MHRFYNNLTYFMDKSACYVRLCRDILCKYEFKLSIVDYGRAEQIYKIYTNIHTAACKELVL
jgi:hypothetical protein